MNVPIIGIDVAKKKFDVALLREEKYKTRSFDNTAAGFSAFCAWLEKQGANAVRACMEATGSYGDNLAKFLFEKGHTVHIVNPIRIKKYGESELLRNKNDKIDSKLIARFCERHKDLAAWQPDPPEIEHLRMLGRRREVLVAMRTQELNRLGNPDNAVNDSIENVIDFLEKEIEKISSSIKTHIKNTPSLKMKRDLLKTIPGVGDVLAEIVLSELGGFIRFDRVQKVEAYIGLSPKQHESGSSIKGKPSICKIGSARIRKGLYMPALSAMQCNPYVRALYLRLAAKSKHGLVIACACMKKLVRIMFGVLKSGKPFDPALA